MKNKKACSNCIKGLKLNYYKDIFCRENGIVSADYVCSKHRTTLERYMDSKCINCSFFSVGLNNKSSSTMGKCTLFSVREYNGERKKACSKFAMKHEEVVI